MLIILRLLHWNGIDLGSIYMSFLGGQLPLRKTEEPKEGKMDLKQQKQHYTMHLSLNKTLD